MMWTLLCGLSWAQEVDGKDVIGVPTGPIEEPRRGPDRAGYERLDAVQRLLKEQSEKGVQDEAEIERLQGLLRQAAQEQLDEQRTKAEGVSNPSSRVPGAVPPLALPMPAPSSKAQGKSKPEAPRFGRRRPKVGETVGSPAVARGPTPMVFVVPEGAQPSKKLVLPAGSYVKARILTGVEAGDSELIPMTLQADYAAVGPNGTEIDLEGCVIIAQVSGQLSTDRVVGKAVTLSCVRDDGKLIEIDLDGYLVGEDSTLGIVGQLVSRQGRVLAAATVANLAKGAGDAVQAASTTTTVVGNPLGGGQTASNVTGDRVGFAAAGAVSEATADIADWYLSYAQKLTPAIAVGSGRDVWIVTLSGTEFEGLH